MCGTGTQISGCLREFSACVNLQSLCGIGVFLFAVRMLAKPYHFGVN